MKKKLALATILLLPFVFLLYMLFVVEVEDPIKYIYTITGATALMLLYITTIISMLKKAINIVKYRRMVGLFSFFYALLHMINFVVLDMELDAASVISETLKRPFIYLGTISFLLLVFMSITSTKKLFPKFYKYHKVIYISILLSSVHFVMAQKALSVEQWVYLGIMGIVLIFKLLQRTKIIHI